MKHKPKQPRNPRKFTCPGCDKYATATTHHIFPRRFFPTNRKENKLYSYMCTDCHRRLEKLIEQEEFERGGTFRKQLTRERYVAIVQEFFDRSWEHA
jgi:uncharacterized protein YlaI